MRTYDIIFLLLSIMFTIISSWNLNIMYRLSNAKNIYSSSEAMEDACHVSKTYVNIGMITSIITLFTSIVILIFIFSSLKNEQIL